MFSLRYCHISFQLDPLCNPRFLPSLMNSAGHMTESIAITTMVGTDIIVIAKTPTLVAPSASVTLFFLTCGSPEN